VAQSRPTRRISARELKRRRSFWVVSGLVVGAIVAAGVVVLIAGLAPSGLPDGTSLTAFELAIKTDIAGPTSRGGFNVPGVASVRCLMPPSRKPGETFTCYAFRKGYLELGSISGVVRPATPGKAWNAELEWNGGA